MMPLCPQESSLEAMNSQVTWGALAASLPTLGEEEGSNNEEQVDGEADSVGVKEQIWPMYSYKHDKDH